MSREGMQAVFGTAITDSNFCQTLLESPAKAIQGFDLTEDEFAALARIRADSLQQFAAKFERWRLSKGIDNERPGSRRSGYRYAGKRMAG